MLLPDFFFLSSNRERVHSIWNIAQKKPGLEYCRLPYTLTTYRFICHLSTGWGFHLSTPLGHN